LPTASRPGTLLKVDDEAVDLALGFLADIAVYTRRIVELLEGENGEEAQED
jgi:hypothetical protein